MEFILATLLGLVACLALLRRRHQQRAAQEERDIALTAQTYRRLREL